MRPHWFHEKTEAMLKFHFKIAHPSIVARGTDLSRSELLRLDRAVHFETGLAIEYRRSNFASSNRHPL
jgi:hypothetical protein